MSIGDGRIGYARPRMRGKSPQSPPAKAPRPNPAKAPRPNPAQAPRPKPAQAPRVRRTAEEARRAILDAAERQLGDVGPSGLRLQEIAREVGVSHPALLHHFGSREGLVKAVVVRAIEGLQAALVDAIALIPPGEMETARLFEQVSTVLSQKGYARVMAWVILSGHAESEELSSLRVVADATHARRRELWAEAGSGEPSYEDTRFTVLLSALVMFADGFAGAEMRASAGLADDENAALRFRAWLGALVNAHLAPPSP
jgi:AcrR family transcriptional regulator